MAAFDCKKSGRCKRGYCKTCPEYGLCKNCRNNTFCRADGCKPKKKHAEIWP